MARHLIPCDCGSQISVRTSQAGERIACPQCQSQVAVPSLRELTKLPLDTAKRNSGIAFLPKRTLPRSTTGLVLGALFLAVAAFTPVLIALGVFEGAFSHSHPADPRRTFFQLDNLQLWGGLGFLALSGAISLLRGLGFSVGGPRRRLDD